MIRLGLTGSLAMGKSTLVSVFTDRGIPVHDSDAVVQDLYRPDGAATALLARMFGDVLGADGGISRHRLADLVWSDPGARKRLERVVHPMVASDRKDFLARERCAGTRIVVLDVPLLFETGGVGSVDKVLVVSCAEAEQRRRALARPGMTPARLRAILSAQMTDAEKRARADYVIDTGADRRSIAAELDRIIAELDDLAFCQRTSGHAATTGS